MYSVVLMAALATSSSAPDFGHRCSGCSGYSGGHGCHGGGYATWCTGGWGCYGWGCYGSTGMGCYAGWSGWGCRGGGGCYGGGYGGGCHGGWGCYGATGWGCTGGYGCYGGGYGSPYVVCGGGPGAYGGYSGYGVPVPGGMVVNPGTASPVTPVTPSGPAPEVTPEPKKKGELSRAKVRILVPADAKLYVDGVLMKTGTPERVFQTPELNPAQTYYYDVRAEILRGDQVYAETQQLVVRPGTESTASFAGLEAKAALATQAPPVTAVQR